MPLTKPTLIETVAFDAHNEHVSCFVVGWGGPEILANRFIIGTQETNEVVYDEKQETFRFEHVVNANELTNNTYYNATVTVFDNEDNESTASSPIQFWCYTTPTIEIDNMPENRIVENASYNFEFTYNQVENEKINSYIVNLYSISQELLTTSGVQYVTEGTPPYNGNYLLEGFNSQTIYYIEIRCETINGTQVTTGLEQFTVRYSHPEVFSLIELVNNCDGGYVSVYSNIVLIEGESNPSPPNYIDNKEVDLTNPEHWVEWNKGYSISGDMLVRLWFRKPNNYAEILKMSNVNGQTISLKFMNGYENKDSADLQAYMEATVTSIEGFTYYIISNFMDILTDTEYYCVWLTRKNDIYKLEMGKV